MAGNPKQTKKTAPKTKTKVIEPIDNITYYTILGDHDQIDENGHPICLNENTKVCAKLKKTENKTRYFIKTGLHGKIYNPIGMYSEGTSAKFLSRIGKNAWSYKEVNQRVFDMYLSFLKSKNLAWLNNAQRELT